MSMRDNIMRVMAVVVVLAMESFAADEVLLENNFDGNAGNDTGPAILGYGWGGTAVASTGQITTAANNTYGGFQAVTNVDASAGSSFTITWTIASLSTNANGYIHWNGFGMGVSAKNKGGSGGLIFDAAVRPSLAVFVDGGNGWSGYTPADWSLLEVSGVSNATYVASSFTGTKPTMASIEDGFTISLTVNSDNTWEVSSTGLSNTETNTGSLSANVTYANLAATLYPNIQLGGLNLSCAVDHVVVSYVPPPPAGTVIMIR